MSKPQIILGIETSCDETAAAVIQKDLDGIHILSNVVASSAALQAKYGGVIPEQAAREQLKSIIPVISEALKQAHIQHQVLDAIAVTQGPGLIGSLLVGVETAKTLALVWKKPLIPVNHLIGHFYANWIDHSVIPTEAGIYKNKGWIPDQVRDDKNEVPSFPCTGLLVSGGHTDLVLFKDHGKYQYLGGTRDDAAGECFDKCARLLNLPYPGGPNLSKLAEKGNPKAYNLPRPMMDSKDFDFSFSGLKTAVVNLVNARGVTRKRVPIASPAAIARMDDGILERQDPELVADLASSIEAAITDVLVDKAVRAIQTYNVEQFIVAGGVAANQILAQKLTQSMSELASRAWLHIPPPSLCTDNAAMIAAAALYNFHPIDPLLLQADPNLSLS